ncbi:hypothetical protein AVEN_179424-1 [Araneus ventricosus]|uniref:Uncharacterized protein n=1 Tax=Araneus ventricosus TaxID=182803 RepID=A0A4Y2BE58_ARAVE|nr:hypothetical protein AVEN_179424-1 [Araneus ventricosus]
MQDGLCNFESRSGDKDDILAGILHYAKIHNKPTRRHLTPDQIRQTTKPPLIANLLWNEGSNSLSLNHSRIRGFPSFLGKLNLPEGFYKICS